MCYIGVDIGGTNISAGLVGENGDILETGSVKTNSSRFYSEIGADIVGLILNLLEKRNFALNELKWIGVGCPGACNVKTGVVEFSNNLNWINVPLRDVIESSLGVKTYIDNDANAAAYGEFLFGAAKGVNSAVVITIGTGIGSGVIINKQIFRGENYAGPEIGHAVIISDGLECNCGRKGCFEAYASASGLIRMTREAIEACPETKMRELAETEGKISARTAFNAARIGDETGIGVVEKYAGYLSCGITNVINIFQPDILCLGGGVSNEGEYLLEKVRKIVSRNVYSRYSKKQTKISVCEFGNKAGIIGAAMLGHLY